MIQIQEDYQYSLVKPNKGADFLCQFMYTDRSSLDMENFRFVLEDGKGRHWEAGELWEAGASGLKSLRNVESRSVLGTNVYRGVIDLSFYFSEDKRPNWDELILYVIRTDVVKRTEFTWDFE